MHVRAGPAGTRYGHSAFCNALCPGPSGVSLRRHPSTTRVAAAPDIFRNQRATRRPAPRWRHRGGRITIGHDCAHDQQDPRRRRRPAAARSAAALPRRTGLQRVPRGERVRDEQAVDARALRPSRARPDAAGRRRPRDLPQAARHRRHDADHHAHGPRRRGRSHHRARARRRRLPAEAVQPARAGRAHPRGAAPAQRARGAGRAGRRRRELRVRPVQPRPAHAHADEGRRVEAADDRRVRRDEGLRAPSASTAVAREADGAGARSRVRGLRPLASTCRSRGCAS